jgi:hypothetical protein
MIKIKSQRMGIIGRNSISRLISRFLPSTLRLSPPIRSSPTDNDDDAADDERLYDTTPSALVATLARDEF